MEKISFELFGLTLLEPLSTLMNWVLMVECIYFYQKLKSEQNNSFQKYWAWFFLAYAISLFFGGFSHLLFHYTGMAGKIPGWTFALLGVTAGELAMVADIQNEKKKLMLLNVIRSSLFASAALLVFDFSFKWVMVHTAGLFLFVSIISFKRWKAGQLGYRFFLFGMVCLLLMAPVKVAGLDIHPAWFNRDDIAHIFMLIAYWMFYKGVRSVKETHSS